MTTTPTIRIPGWQVHVFEESASTMDEAHTLVARGAEDHTLVWAWRQTQGRGRQGRAWASPEGGLYCSMIFRPTRPAAETPQLALTAGLAAAETLRDVACVYPSIRWPNDLMIHEKKLGGILTESKTTAVVVGIGINVAPDLRLPQGSTSLADEGAGHVSREELLTGLCTRMSTWYGTWIARGFQPVREALRPWIGLFGHPIHLTSGAQRLEGVAQDVDEQGRLVVRLDTGVLRAFEAGEVELLR